MAEFLLELLAEEIPARMQTRGAQDLKTLVTDKLTELKLTFTKSEGLATPRRLAVWVDGLPATQPERLNEIKGPRVTAPDHVIEAFLKARKISSLDQCERRGTERNASWFYIERIPGLPTGQVLASILPDAVLGIPWPKSMRWGYDKASWVRPLHNIMAVFNGELVSFEVDLGTPEHPHKIASRKETYGHRFLGPQSFTVSNFNTYKARLGVRQVIVDPAERRHVIGKHAERLARTESLAVRRDDALMDEVVGLVEWPVVLMGRIDPAFMDLPPEVLTTTMRANQRYFALQNAEGKLAPRFLVVANMETRDHGATIIAGNERVLRARLADAQFFWDHDRKLGLEARLPALKSIIFHAKLGTLADKIERIEKLALEIARDLPGGDISKDVSRAARLCKADLTTGMVGEFPELQGIMGRYYALDAGESPAVANAIAEHYAPLGPSERCPSAPVSVALALADKIDTLVGFWAIGEKPTGSRDPYALRRAALGVIRLVVENGLRVPFHRLMELASFNYNEMQRGMLMGFDPADLLEFFADRLKVALKEKGVRNDLIAAVFALKRENGLGEDDFVRLLTRVDALAKFLSSEDGVNLLTASKRAGNILRIEEKKDGRGYDEVPDASLLRLPEEFTLVEAMRDARDRTEAALKREAYTAAMAALARLREPVDDFFDKVTVNDDDSSQRANRLRLLSRIRATLNTVADFSKIEG